MNDLISIIVPIYKVEQYLERCVDSIINQTYQNLQIILVDDGSPDNCGLICDRYAENDSRITVIHKPNGGLSDARNCGLDKAIGDYIFFIDADDWIPIDALENLFMRFSMYCVDIVAGSSVDVVDNNGKCEHKRYSVSLGTEQLLDKHEAMKDNLMYGWAAWNKLYRSELFKDIRFPKGIINEDEAILTHVIDKCTMIAKVGIPTYYYYLRENSITTSDFSERKMDWYNNCKNNYNYIISNHPNLKAEAEYRLINAIM